ncbi:MAG: site-specific DNA-methyltransferase [Elusimicrobiota bacterium]|jgi:site-specific DNA-methyltransferase (adenine-specific)|nr:site-specific DNA-methyltransferase [Elusimicrobiota bacterium]
MTYKNKIFNENCLDGAIKIPEKAIDLIIADPPYCLGKDYGNNSDKMQSEEYLRWTYKWLDIFIPKLKEDGSLYIFLSWRYSPEIFTYIKKKMLMINEIIWDRRVPSMGGSTRKFSSVHDNIGFFVNSKNYYFNLDKIRIPYDEEVKKARTRTIFIGKKWLELGYNPKDLWSISRIHRQEKERENHPTQKPLEIIDRLILASCPDNGIVLDPFLGSGTTIISAIKNNVNYCGFEINEKYFENIEKRIKNNSNMFNFNNFEIECSL